MRSDFSLNKSAIDLSNVNPALVVTKKYEGQPATQTNRDPNRDKKLCDSSSNGEQVSKRFIKPPSSIISRATSIDSDF